MIGQTLRLDGELQVTRGQLLVIEGLTWPAPGGRETDFGFPQNRPSGVRYGECSCQGVLRETWGYTWSWWLSQALRKGGWPYA